LQSISNLISHFTEDAVLLIRRGKRRVIKTLMEPLPATGKYRARLLRVVADSEDICELLAREFIHRLGSASRNIDPNLRHYFDGIRIQAGGTGARAEYLEPVTCQVP